MCASKLSLALLLLAATATTACRTKRPPPPAAGAPSTTSTTAAAGPVSAAPEAPEPELETPVDTTKITAELVAKHGESHRPAIERGLKQVAALWRTEDGDLAAFAREYYLADDKLRDQVFARYEALFEQLEGHMLEISRELRRPSDVDIGPMLPVDPLFAALDPSAHLTEDLFASKLGFVVLLNFRLSDLKQKIAEGDTWTRRQWAEARLAGRFARRVPPEVQQAITRANAEADLYIAEYNIWMHHLVNDAGERLFPKGLRLISHWNLRDELKADYADPRGLEKQRTIVKVMERIVTQTIPDAVIDNPRVDWNPFTNAVTAAPAAAIEENAPDRPVVVSNSPEPDRRYARFLANYHASRRADPYSPLTPTQIQRSYELGRELSEERARKLLTDVLSSPLVPKVAALIEQRLGRKLETQDLWYAGFKAGGGRQESELDAITKKRYPTPEAFAKDMPRILEKLGFPRARAKFLAEHIAVDPSRGAGHAMPAGRRGDLPRLRTRVGPDGMNYKGYNIAVHELGHNVEQVISLYEVDHTLLAGVPNTAFTEALAFVFQARDLELLGLSKPDPELERMRVLASFWATWEIAGVALVDLDVWHWMYDHPDATPAELREATVKISREYWRKYYAPVLGGTDTPLLGIYSHMIAYPLYLANYPIGHLIAFQIEEALKKSPKLGVEFERMAKFGAVLPDLWMKNATGAPISAEPLLRATEAALAGR